MVEPADEYLEDKTLSRVPRASGVERLKTLSYRDLVPRNLMVLKLEAS
jgi:hypothetical protein